MPRSNTGRSEAALPLFLFQGRTFFWWPGLSHRLCGGRRSGPTFITKLNIKAGLPLRSVSCARGATVAEVEVARTPLTQT